MIGLAAALLQVAPLADLRVGEAGEVARVVLVCEARCAASPSDEGPGAYRIEGVRDTVEIETGGALIGALRVTPEGDGATLSVETVRPPRQVRLSRCEPRALCFDFDLSDAPPPPPPPSLGTVTRGVEAFSAKGPPGTLRARLEAEAGRPLDGPACKAARVTLAADAWALDAFRTVALCRALDGAREDADGLLARLETYVPDEETARLRALVALPARERAATGPE